MFKSEAIILSSEYIRDAQSRVSLFSREYGKISAWLYKKSKSFDIWDIVEISLERKWWRNIMKSEEKKHSLLGIKWEYEGIIWMLSLLSLFKQMLPEDVPYNHLFEDYKEILTRMQENWVWLSKYQELLVKIRLLKFLWVLNTTGIENPLISYIAREITHVDIAKILISRHHEKIANQDLEKIVYNSVRIN